MEAPIPNDHREKLQILERHLQSFRVTDLLNEIDDLPTNNPFVLGHAVYWDDLYLGTNDLYRGLFLAHTKPAKADPKKDYGYLAAVRNKRGEDVLVHVNAYPFGGRYGGSYLTINTISDEALVASPSLLAMVSPESLGHSLDLARSAQTQLLSALKTLPHNVDELPYWATGVIAIPFRDLSSAEGIFTNQSHW